MSLLKPTFFKAKIEEFPSCFVIVFRKETVYDSDLTAPTSHSPKDARPCHRVTYLSVLTERLLLPAGNFALTDFFEVLHSNKLLAITCEFLVKTDLEA